MVAPWKKKEVDEIAAKLKKSKVVGIVSVVGIPSRQLQQMRKTFGDKLDIKVARNNIIKHALKKAKVNEELANYLKGPSGIVLTDLSPFKLEKLFTDNKTKAPAKPGSVSPTNIVIPKGETPFAPGPIIGELQGVGIKAKIQGGKIVVLEDCTVVSAGKVVSPELASVLMRFGIEPVEIRLRLGAALEEGVVYPGEVLHIDERETIAKITSAYQNAINLAFNAKVVNSVTVPYFIRDAQRKAINLAFNAGIYTKETLQFMIAQANREVQALASRVPEAPAGDATSKAADAGVEKKEGAP